MTAKERCLKHTDTDGICAVYVFTPSVFRLVPPRIRHSFSVIDRAKLLLRVLNGYYVYYETDADKMMGYCFLKRNYLRKYAFLQKQDVLINPYFVSPEYRGNGLGGKLIKAAISDSETSWKTVYAVVKEENMPSIRTLEKLGFQKVGCSDKKGWSHRLTEQKTHLPVFCLTRTEKQEKTV